MANEANIRTSLQIRKGNVVYQSQPTGFAADITGTAKGPTPGAISVAVTGTNVDLSQLTTPGLCRIQNLDETNYITVGIYDGVSFFPLMELLPDESFVIRLFRFIGDEYVGTGTPADVNYLRIKADTAACVALVEAFEK